MYMDRDRLQLRQSPFDQTVPFGLRAISGDAQQARIAVRPADGNGKATIRNAKVMGIAENPVELFVPIKTLPIDWRDTPARAVQGRVVSV